jgi:hypothetical protein
MDWRHMVQNRDQWLASVMMVASQGLGSMESVGLVNNSMQKPEISVIYLYNYITVLNVQYHNLLNTSIIPLTKS